MLDQPSPARAARIEAQNRKQLPDGVRFQAHTGTRDSSCEFRRLGRLAWYESRTVNPADASAGTREVTSYEAARVETLITDSTGRTIGTFSRTKPLPEPSLIDRALGIRLLYGDGWLTADQLTAADVKWPDPDHAVVTLRDDKNRLHTLTFSRKNGYALEEATVQSTANGNQVIELVNSDFREVGGIVLPYKTDFRNQFKSAAGESDATTTDLTVMEYRLADPHNTKDRYSIVWPVNASLLDERTGRDFKVGGRDHALTDEALDAAVKRTGAADGSGR